MPAAAVIPAPVAYIKVVAVKKLVVGFLADCSGPCSFRRVCRDTFAILPESSSPFTWPARSGSITLKKLECLKQAYAMNTLAWNNNLGLCSYFVGLRNKVMIDRDSWGC